ncbi:MAG: hypothetical protein AAB697_02610 [Patescibacteria group bacterium]
MEVVPEFTQKDLVSIARQRGLVYFLNGLSIAGLKSERDQAGKPSYWYNYLKGKPAENQLGLVGQVAIFPEDPMLQGAYYRMLPEQLKLVKGHAKDLDLVCAQAIVGTISTLTGALFAHADVRGEYLLSNVWARSTTIVESPYVAIVGDSNPREGFHVDDWDQDERVDHLGVLRLIVPVRK